MMVIEFFQKLRNLDELVRWGGYLVLGLIVFAETGLLVGFFLPGDALLVTAGAIAATTDLLDIWTLNLLLITCAIVGDATGYYIGARAGPALFKRPKSLFFRPEHLVATQEFYEKHGGKAIILARFLPLARTFVPVIAGSARMPYRRFAALNVSGGILWVSSLTLLGYGLGRAVSPKRIEQVIYLIILIVITPVLLQGIKTWRKQRKAAATSPAEGSTP